MPGSTDRRTSGWREYAVMVLWVLPVLAALVCYRWIGHHAEAVGTAWMVRLPLDDQIPFVSAFVYAYVFWYLYSYGAILLLMLRPGGGHVFRHYVLSMFLVLLVALVVFVIFPTTVLRPDVPGDSLAAKIVRQIYQIDPPYNCLPSIHVAFSTLTLLELDRLLRSKKGQPHPVARGVGRVANLIAASLICLSTLFIKQHYSPDLFAGIAVALTAGYGAQSILMAGARFRDRKRAA